MVDPSLQTISLTNLGIGEQACLLGSPSHCPMATQLLNFISWYEWVLQGVKTHQFTVPTFLAILTIFAPLAWGVHSANLSWDANAETDIAGYKFYYGDTSGSTTNIIDVGNQLTYTTPSLVGGKSYFFFV